MLVLASCFKTFGQNLDWLYQSKQEHYASQRILGSVLKENNNAVVLFITNDNTAELVGDSYSEEFASRSTVLVEFSPNGVIMNSFQIGFRAENGEKRVGEIKLAKGPSDDLYISFLLDEAVDVSLGNQVVASFTPSSASIENSKAIGVLKLGSDGQFDASWTVHFTEKLYGYHDLKVSDSGVYILYSQVKQEYSPPGQSKSYDLNYFVKRFDMSGVLMDEITFTGFMSNRTNNNENRLFFNSMAVSDTGEVYLSGRVTNDVYTTLSDEFPLNATSNAAKAGTLVVKLSLDLDFVWKRSFTGGAFNFISAPIVSPDGGVVFTYSIQDDFGVSGNPMIRIHETGDEVSVKDRLDRVYRRNLSAIIKLANNGDLVWTAVSINGLFDEVNQNDKGEVYVYYSRTSGFQGADHLGVIYNVENPKAVDGRFQDFVIKLDSEGNYLNTTHFTRLSDEPGHYIEADWGYLLPLNTDCEEFFFTAVFNGDFDLEPSPDKYYSVNSTANGDAFFGKFGNSEPKIIISDLIDSVCGNTTYSKEFQIIDETPDNLKLEVTSSNMDVVPLDSIRVENVGSQYTMGVNLGVSGGETTITVKVIDDCGYQDSFDLKLQIENGIVTPIVNNGVTEYVLCEGDALELSTNEGNNTWSNGSNRNSITVTQSGQYWVSRSSESGCVALTSDTVNVEFVPKPLKPQITVDGSLEFCDGEQVVLNSSVSENILWSTGDTTQSITVNSSGIYSVMQQSEICGNGPSSESISISVNPIPDQPKIIVNGDINFCEGNSVFLSANANDSFYWSNGSTEKQIEITKSGSYSLYVEKNGCVSQISDPINVIVDEDFSMNITKDTTVCEGIEEVELVPEVVGGNVDYHWSDGSASSSLKVNEAGTYWLEVSNGKCEKPRVFIEVQEACYPKIFIPNAFSPNGDSHNDEFEILGSRILGFSIRIFNGWGNMVYKSNDFSSFWDGTYEGSVVPSGVYSYKIIYSGSLSNQLIEFQKSGTVSVLR